MAAVKKPTQWDIKTFEKMSAPIRIRMERKNPRTGQMEPIPLPMDVWSKEDAERIEQIVLNDVAGGGSYKGQMIDAQGVSMEWTFAYPTDYFPPLIPPMSAGALGQVAPATPPPIAGTPAATAAYQRGVYGLPVSPPGQPYVPAYTGQPAQPQFPQMGQFGYAPQMPYGYPPMYPSPYASYGAPPMASARSSSSNGQVEQLRQQLQQTQRQADEERHVRERETQAAAFRQQEVERERKHSDEMRQLREMIAEQKRVRPDDDPALTALKATIDELKRNNERLQQQASEAQRDQQRRDELRIMQESTQRQIDAIKELVRESLSNKDDPKMTMMLELQRQSMESQRENQRVQSEIQREANRLAADSPRQMVDMMERLRSAGGLEQTLSAINTSYMGLMNQQKSIIEMVTQMGPDPKLAMVEGALEGVKGVAERFVGAKRDEAIAKERTEQMKSQERAVAAQAQAQAYAQAAAAQAAAQAPYRYEDGSIKGQPPQRDQLGGQVEGEESTAPPPPNGKPTEEQFFGPLMEQVKALREVVMAEDSEVEPEQIATFVIEAAMAVEREQAFDQTPVYVLYHEQRFADLIDVLLPGLDSESVGECVQALVTKCRELGITPGGSGPVVLDDDVGGEEPDEAQA